MGLSALPLLLAVLGASAVRADVYLTFPVPYQGSNSSVLPSMAAQFGSSLPKTGLSGRIVVLPDDERYACNDLATKAPLGGNYFAVVARGPGDAPSGCPFVQKVYNAFQAGYAGVIVYDNVEEDLFPMGSDDDEDQTPIPSVLVSMQSGQFLLGTPSNTSAVLYPDDITLWPSFLITFIVIIAVIVFLFTLFMFYRQRVLQRKSCQVQVTRQDLSRLMTRLYSQNEDSQDSCCICLEEYAPGTTLRVLPCTHKFHQNCIDPWLLRQRKCPMCKRDPLPSERTPLIQV